MYQFLDYLSEELILLANDYRVVSIINNLSWICAVSGSKCCVGFKTSVTKITMMDAQLKDNYFRFSTKKHYNKPFAELVKKPFNLPELRQFMAKLNNLSERCLFGLNYQHQDKPCNV